jgi:putative tributyrin esterase
MALDLALLADPDAVDLIPAARRLIDHEDGPVLSFDCGVDDELIEENRTFHAQLEEMGLAHHYAEHPGGHDWDYWDLHVQEALAQHAEVLGVSAVSR